MQTVRALYRRSLCIIACCGACAVLLPFAVLHAQEATGGLWGIVESTSLSAVRVVVRNLDTGAVLTRTPGKDGRYSIGGLVPGQYQVDLEQAGRLAGSRRVVVRPGSASIVAKLVMADVPLETLGAVQVHADKLNNAADNTTPIDVSTPVLVRQYNEKLFRKTGVDTSGATDAGSFGNLLTALPTAYLSQVTTGQGSGLASFNGGSGTETRYYINEFDTTYDYTGAGASSVPGDMIGSAQVIANGASAKYSNAMGGSVAATTKNGDNTLRAGFASSIGLPYSHWFNPKYRPYPLGQTDGVRRYLYQDLSTNGQTGMSFNNTYWTSGPVLRDTLFFNLVLQNNQPRAHSHYLSGELGEQWNFYHTSYNNPALNLNWIIGQNQQLDLTAARSDRKNYTRIYDLTEFSNPGSQRNFLRDLLWEGHDAFYLGRYHWRLTDSMDLALMAGYFSHWEQNHFSDAGLHAVRFDARGGVENVLASGLIDSQDPVNYRKRGLRADDTWQLGEHKLQFGAEHYDLYFNSFARYGSNGNDIYYNYGRQAPWTYAGDLVIPANTPVLISREESSGGPLTQVNRGAYVEDYWQASARVLLYGGLRRDNSAAHLANGRKVLGLYTTSPRLGVSWDVRGDSTMKLGASAGIYTLPVPGTILTSLFNDYRSVATAYTYSGINADGTPINPQQIGRYVDESIVGEPVTMTSRRLRNSRQDSYTFYLQDNAWLPHWSSTLEFNYATVKRALAVWNDLNSALSSPAYRYLQSLGYADPHIGNNVMVNPGNAVVLVNDFDGDGQLETVRIPGRETGLAKPRRQSYSASVELVHPELPEQPFFVLLGYTWRHVFGNYEGYYGETNGNVMGAPNFRYGSLSVGNSGALPADVRHVLRFNAAHTFAGSGFSLGMGGTWQSGAPRACYSQYPSAADAAYDAGAAAFYCNGVAVWRGSLGRFPSWWLLDLNAAYEHHRGPGKLRLELNIGNLLNRNTEVYAVPFYGSYTGQVRGHPTWHQDVYYGAKNYLYPRTTALILRYDWN